MRFHHSVVWLGSILFIAFGTGAASGGASTPLGRLEIEAAVQTDPSLQETIRRLEETIPLHDASVFDGFLRSAWLLEHVTQPVADLGLGATLELQSAFCSGTVNSWKTRGLAADYLGEHFKFLRVHTLAGRSGLLFRVAGEKGRLNYCLLTLARDPHGVIGADDLYVVGVGEFVSDTLRRGYLILAESLNPVSASGHRAALYVEHLHDAMAINQALGARDYEKVLSLAKLLPVALRQERSLLLMRLEAAEKTSRAEFARVFAEWQALHPEPLALPLKSADFHIASGNFPVADQLLSQLDRQLGGDVYLRLRIGEVRMLQRHLQRLQTARTPFMAPPESEASAKR